MTKLQRQVSEFHALFKLTVGDTPAIRDPELRARLILEEALETAGGLVGSYRLQAILDTMTFDESQRRKLDSMEQSLVDVADGCADLLYVTYGTAVACGFDLDPISDLVHAANMAKHGGPIDEAGKVRKPPGWTPPDVAGELRKQGWKP